MSDSRGYDEQLPWLQPVDDEDEQRGLSARFGLPVVDFGCGHRR